MLRRLPLLCCLLIGHVALAQNWTGYPAGAIATPYTNGPMTAIVTRVNTTMNSGTPMYTTSTSPDCYIAAGSLALNAGFFNSYIAGSSRIILDIDFTAGGTVTGTCNAATFTIRDINSGESFTDFLDVVEISGVDGNNVALPAANIAITNPVNTTVVTAGTTRRIVGHNSSAETTTAGPYSSTPCNLTSVTITPPAGVPLRSFRILYRPGVGTSSANAYYSVGTHPAVQYISISNLTLTPTGGGCTTLGPELVAFGGMPQADENLLAWTTATTEDAAAQFWLEKSADGIHFMPLEAAIHQAAQDYATADPAPVAETYYRLWRRDDGGLDQVLGTTSVRRVDGRVQLFSIFPNPAQAVLHVQTWWEGDNRISVCDLSGRLVWQGQMTGATQLQVGLEAIPAGLYMVSVANGGQVQHAKCTILH